jgi:hypothetical protein
MIVLPRLIVTVDPETETEETVTFSLPPRVTVKLVVAEVVAERVSLKARASDVPFDATV